MARKGYNTDFTGLVFGQLTVLQYHGPTKWEGSSWECQCTCGKIVVKTKSYLNDTNNPSCGCARLHLDNAKLETIRQKKLIYPSTYAFNSLYATYKRGASSRNKCFDLSKEEFMILLKGNCFYCKREPKQLFPERRKHIEPFIYNGIDRVDNTNGYIWGNVVSCCGRCNRAKMDMSFDDFKEMIFSVAENLKNYGF